MEFFVVIEQQVFYNPSRDAWLNPSLNVTDDIVKAYNQTYPVAAPKPPAAKP